MSSDEKDPKIEEQAETQQEPASMTEAEGSRDNVRASFPIVGIGASAGGLKAFEQFFDNLPEKPGMAFVLIQHLDPHHQSELAEILQNHTKMPVMQIKDLEEIHNNRVYVIPPGQSLTINKNILYLAQQQEPRGKRAPIDHFFRSLAEDQMENAVCIILSGTGSDGVLGLKRIKEQGGIVLVQSPDSAEYEGMPQSAVATGIVDLVAPAAELAQKLVAYYRHAERIQFPQTEEELVKNEADVLQRIFTQLKNHTGADFSRYKRSTILRRLQRRMQVNYAADLTAYLNLLRREPKEAQLLFKDLLISVTNFFRDEEAWEALAQEVIPALFKNKEQGDQIRVWVPGCATGEEAYTLAILLLEESARQKYTLPIQIFATDLDQEALDFARSGIYPEAIATDLTQERLTRFFEQHGSSYRVRHALKEIILFTPHNLIEDAPFARLDLISCRNLLIYLEREVQEFIFRIFRYSLAEEGYLFLGSSESAEQVDELFEPLRKRQRLYRTRPGGVSVPNLLPSAIVEKPGKTKIAQAAADKGANGEKTAPSLGVVHQKLMLHRYAPPSVLVDRNYQIRYKFGDVGRYLQHREGVPSLNLLDNVSKQIRVELRTGLYTVFRYRENVHPRMVRLEENEESEQIRLRIELVTPEIGLEEELALVVFEPAPPTIAEELPKGSDASNSPIVQRLEEELNEVRHRLQTTVEEYETSNEELKSSNEELQSMNEELRSTTEELETGREELRSTNEELSSLNQELKYKVIDLNRANSDLENLMEATNIATIFLDHDLGLKRYTPAVTTLFNIIPSDIGRPFSHISHQFDHTSLHELAEHIIKTLQTIEEEISTQDDQRFLLQMQPYRTLEDRIDGVVITLVDITDLMRAEEEANIRAAQQAVVAELGMDALRGLHLSELLDIAVRKVAATLDVDYAKVLQSLPDSNELLLIAGIGWQEGLVGTTTISGGMDSQAGYTLQSDKPIIVESLSTEKRFSGPSLLIDHGVESGISVVIQGREGPFGVFGAHNRQPRQFTREDTDFLQGVANVLGAAIERQQADEERADLLTRVQGERARLETILQQIPAGIIIADAPSGHLVMFNDQVEKIWRRPNVEADTVEEYIRYPGFYLDGNPLPPENWPLARAIRTGEVISGEEVIIERGDGSRPIISNSAAPIYDETGDIVAGVVIFQDVTEAKEMAAERDRLLKELQTLTATLETRVEKRTEQLRKRSEQLRNMASVLTVAEQRERERISRILHDDLQQLLHATRMHVVMLESGLDGVAIEVLREHTTALEQLNNQALTVTRSLTVELSPPVLRDEGLTQAFGWLAGHMENVYGLQVEVVVEEGAELTTNDLRELAFQMVRELLFNVVKHAEVDEAKLLVQKGENGRCLITVEDQGNGFDLSILDSTNMANNGFGLRNIQDRVELFDGVFTIESTEGIGTRVMIDLARVATEKKEV